MSEGADYIVIGAGSAGCLLANRLSADPKATVLLLEAGGRDWNPLIRVPLAAGLLYFLPSLNWGYETAPSPGLNGRTLAWPRGRVLGGSTAINGMMYMRGHPSDYDHWRQMGLAGWSYDDVLPLFKRFEHNVSHADDYHGHDGELWTEKARGDHPLYRAWLEAARGLHTPNEDFNGAEQEGVGLYDFNIRDGRRVSAAAAFLTPVRNRPNLRVMTGVHVRRLTLSDGRCAGVEVDSDGRVLALRARREVVLSAGAVNSPQLLMLSGIGDAGRLREHGVAPAVDLPEVGRNLQDHLGVYVQHASLQANTLYGLMRPDRAVLAGLRALVTGKGPAASVPLEAGGFLRTRADLDIPDVHVTFVPGLSLATTRMGQMRHGFLTNCYQLRPESRGTVELASADPYAKPVLRPNYLSAPRDLRCLCDGVRLVRRIAAQPALDPYRGAELSPGVDVTTDEEIDRWVRDTANTVFHPVGTCRMGPDPASVVDPALRVRGVAGLRVADASVMPAIVGGNTSAPTMMIAEKCAALMAGA